MTEHDDLTTGGTAFVQPVRAQWLMARIALPEKMMAVGAQTKFGESWRQTVVGPLAPPATRARLLIMSAYYWDWRVDQVFWVISFEI